MVMWPFTRVQYLVVFSCSVLTTLCSFFIQLPLIQLPLLYHINIYHRKSGVQPLEILKLDEESRLKKKLSCLKRTPSQPVLFLKIIFCYTLHFAYPLAESAGFCSPAESHAGSLCPTGKDFSRRTVSACTVRSAPSLRSFQALRKSKLKFPLHLITSSIPTSRICLQFINVRTVEGCWACSRPSG